MVDAVSPSVADDFPSFADREFELAAEADTLRSIIESQKKEIDEHVLRTLVLRTYAEALDGSASWRALAPLRVAEPSGSAARFHGRAICCPGPGWNRSPVRRPARGGRLTTIRSSSSPVTCRPDGCGCG